MADGLDLEAWRPILTQHGICLAVLFGSRARGTARERSDVDIGVLRSDGCALSYRQLATLSEALAAHSLLPLDVTDLAPTDPLLRMEVVRDGELLFARSREDWVDFVAKTLIEHDDVALFIDDLIRGVGRAAREAAR